jgi:hypothetical protein
MVLSVRLCVAVGCVAAVRVWTAWYSLQPLPSAGRMTITALAALCRLPHAAPPPCSHRHRHLHVPQALSQHARVINKVKVSYGVSSGCCMGNQQTNWNSVFSKVPTENGAITVS